MVRLNELDLEWDGDLGRVLKIRPGGIEDWLLMRKLAAVFSAVGSLSALILALLIPPFSDVGFAIAYGLFALAGAGFAVAVAGRAATVMKFETGPRFLDIPRLSRALWLAGLLVLPCLVLQIVYPLKIVLGHRQLTISDVKSAQDIVRLYDELDRGTVISFPTIKGQDEPSIDAAVAQKVLDSQSLLARTWRDEAKAVYDGVKSLLLRYPDLASEADVLAEQTQLSEVIKARITALEGMDGESISQKYKSKREDIREKRKQDEEKFGKRTAANMEEVYAFRMGVSDIQYSHELPATNLSCRKGSGSLGCPLLYRLDMLSRLRERSFGPALVSSFGTALVPNPTISNFFGVSLYALLFGWQGILPILVIAATFGILVRVQRLTDRHGPYVVGAIGIIGIVIWESFSPTKATPAWLRETIRLPDLSLPFAMLLLPAWMLMMLGMATSTEESAGATKDSNQGIYVRLCMLALPTIPLLLIGWEPDSDSARWLIGILASIIAVGLGALIPWLDKLMLEANCMPRVT